MMPVDTIFSEKRKKADFVFNEEVVNVFSDMIKRSAPGYPMIVEQIGRFAPLFAEDNATIYDLGCSLGAVSNALRHSIRTENTKIIAVDNSAPMIEKATQFFKLQNQVHDGLIPIELKQADIRHIEFDPAAIIVLNLTLQFIEPSERLALLTKIRQALLPTGALFLSEKIYFDDAEEQSVLDDMHLAFKRANGYSELEIAQKREAIENVMRIDSFAIHKARLHEAGFTRVYQWFQCLNFISIVALP
ncbi:carboxy-S-adenosyl-L-methionine synthase CmoA [Wohlfahrtiimonas sp. G9077]|uniref:carboxy-S-adenosyl-L-methionine synthase CmoA n=1 Tax=Wohlfahrtiimonas sp. G9077 TaxID=1980118 RepID=UPI000B97EDE2|nr:carboxy-S-adenosyl-L-methionine synthase CmoA [Wohlfahrtiimonas sp. G9077]OYQ75145.1 carboxy-S-adenosyl-L-methionine synthase CmoA [Wohlfahrtiimonas sp. G9077]